MNNLPPLAAIGVLPTTMVMPPATAGLETQSGVLQEVVEVGTQEGMMEMKGLEMVEVEVPGMQGSRGCSVVDVSAAGKICRCARS